MIKDYDIYHRKKTLKDITYDIVIISFFFTSVHSFLRVSGPSSTASSYPTRELVCAPTMTKLKKGDVHVSLKVISFEDLYRQISCLIKNLLKTNIGEHWWINWLFLHWYIRLFVNSFPSTISSLSSSRMTLWPLLYKSDIKYSLKTLF